MTDQLPLNLEPENTELETEKLETRNRYLERLRQKLQDPDFRAIEGFPIAEDEAILALSDPPYYTACPNPFLPEIIERWQAERAQLREELGLPDDSADNGDSPPPHAGEGPGVGVYHREPFAADVSEGKNDPIYNAHSYHTKVPHKAIMRYILHYTEPGDIVFDGFCGTGMTGVAAQLCGDRKTVESLGYFIDDDGHIYDQAPPKETNPKSKIQNPKSAQPISRLGSRKAVLCDLSPAATFIAYNYNTPVDVKAFEKEARRILREVEEECGWMYETWHVEPASCRLIERVITQGRPLPKPESGGKSGEDILSSPAGRMPAPPSTSPKGISEFTVRQGDLPHWQLPGAHYFITFNTANQRQLSPAARNIILNALKYWDVDSDGEDIPSSQAGKRPAPQDKGGEDILSSQAGKRPAPQDKGGEDILSSQAGKRPAPQDKGREDILSSQAGRMPAPQDKGREDILSSQAGKRPAPQDKGGEDILSSQAGRMPAPPGKSPAPRLQLIAAVVMPDHVHAVLAPLERAPGVYWDLSDLMHSIKSYSANRINEVEERKGETVWQDETYDHIIRNLAEYHRILSYIAYNPVKVGLAASPGEYRWFWLLKELKGAGWKPAPLGRINYTVWSDVFLCPECGAEMVYWDVALDEEAGKALPSFSCPQCGAEQRKRTLQRAMETVYDRELGQTIQRAKQVSVLIKYWVGKKSYTKQPDANDLSLIQKIEDDDIPYSFPKDRMPEGEESRRNDDLGMTHAHHLYTRRNLWALAAIWHRILSAPLRTKFLMGFSFTANLRSVSRFASIAFSYYFKGGGGPINAGTKGTLYVSSTVPEVSVLKGISGRTDTVIKLHKRQRIYQEQNNQSGVAVTTQSSSAFGLPDQSVDYIFVDPPFGGNLMYSELSFYWEAWLRILTNNASEAIVNQVQNKRLPEYQRLMEKCFNEFHRLLRPGRWMTVEFHNTSNAVWNAIQEALLRAGFMVADVRSLDKKQGSFKQYNAAGSVKQDLIISAYKPRTDFEQQFLAEGGREKGAWEFVRQHLEQLPVLVEKDGALEVVAERQAYLLYDRMVAFHIQRGFSVPLSAAEFYAGLRQRFPERDGMYFLPPQAAEYDKRRLQVQRVEQLALFVTDEKSAIQWLQRELDSDTGSGPQTYQDLQPKFLRELHQARHEQLPELRDLLEENFLQDAQERWFVPNPERQEHLEQLRERSLLREFQEYAAVGASGRSPKLKVFRTEAVRAGFKRAWADKQYRLIVQVAQRLPASVLQEDPGLLMYYDNALLRAEAE